MAASKKSISQQARIKTKTLKRDNSRKPLDLQELKTEINSNTIIQKNKANFIPSTVIDQESTFQSVNPKQSFRRMKMSSRLTNKSQLHVGKNASFSEITGGRDRSASPKKLINTKNDKESTSRLENHRVDTEVKKDQKQSSRNHEKFAKLEALSKDDYRHLRGNTSRMS